MAWVAAALNVSCFDCPVLSTHHALVGSVFIETATAYAAALVVETQVVTPALADFAPAIWLRMTGSLNIVLATPDPGTGQTPRAWAVQVEVVE